MLQGNSRQPGRLGKNKRLSEPVLNLALKYGGMTSPRPLRQCPVPPEPPTDVASQRLVAQLLR